MKKQKYAIIVAGGSGTRMKSSTPKQFLSLNGKPIIAHTINKFLQTDCEIIVVLPPHHFKTFKENVLHHCNSQEMVLAEGGATRFHSVKNGLNCIKPNGLVAIHDAVRPLISTETIYNCFKTADNKGNAVASVALKDSIRKVESPDKNIAQNRSDYFLVQTPQTFDGDLLLKAYECDYKDHFTDDASVFENAGHSIQLVEGDYKNIKITTPEDLTVAKALLDEEL